MRKVIYLLACICLILTGCGKSEYSEDNKKPLEENSIQDIYMEVLENKRSFENYYYVDSANIKVEGTKKIESYYDNLENHKLKYTFVDLDQDNNKELVVDVENGNVIIFKYDEETKIMYGYEKYIRSFKNLKENGYYEASGGAGSKIIYHCIFVDEGMIEMELAQEDYGKYTIAEKEVTEQAYRDYISENFDSQKEVEWLEFTVQNDKTEEQEETKGFQVGNHVVKYGTYYVKSVDGTLLRDGSGTIEIKEDNTCSYIEGWADMECISYYASTKNNQDAICLKTKSDEICFTIDNDTIQLNERNIFQYSN